MAQPQLQQGEGPIALVLEPTRELAVQTYHVPWWWNLVVPFFGMAGEDVFPIEHAGFSILSCDHFQGCNVHIETSEATVAAKD